jgi:hypothetical protein
MVYANLGVQLVELNHVHPSQLLSEAAVEVGFGRIIVQEDKESEIPTKPVIAVFRKDLFGTAVGGSDDISHLMGQFVSKFAGGDTVFPNEGTKPNDAKAEEIGVDGVVTVLGGVEWPTFRGSHMKKTIGFGFSSGLERNSISAMGALLRLARLVRTPTEISLDSDNNENRIRWSGEVIEASFPPNTPRARFGLVRSLGVIAGINASANR